MSIQSEVNRITANIASAYTAAAEKNAAMPSQQNSENLATTILSIPVGTELPELTNPGTAEYLLEGTELIDEEGGVVVGEMPFNEADVISVNDVFAVNPNIIPKYTIPKGYHDGKGYVTVNLHGYGTIITPSKEKVVFDALQTGAFINELTIDPIPDRYQDVTPVTATAEDVAVGKVFVDATGAVVTGTFDVSEEIARQDELLEQIKASLTEKAAGGAPSEYYTITNNTGLDMVIHDCVVAAGATVDVPVDIEAIEAVGSYLLAYTTATPTGYKKIVATTNGSLTVGSNIARVTIYCGAVSMGAFMAALDIGTSTANGMVPPASGSTIVLTLA